MDMIVAINSFMWDYILMFLLVGTGIFLTLRLRFVQARKFPEGFKLVFGGLFKRDKSQNGSMTSFQALSTSIAAQVGTGNLAGAANAIAIGGPGAIFWMWVSAILGMSTIYAEATLAQRYRKVAEDGTVTGGSVYYIREAFKGTFGKVLAASFAIFIILALAFMGNMVQSNSIASSFSTAFGLPPLVMGIVLAVGTFFVVIGGVKRIASFAELFVPVMALFYILGALVVLVVNIEHVPSAIGSIFVGAFNPQALAGGVVGATIKLAIQKGIQRGLFSNEAGMGSTPHAHAVANVKHPCQQGAVAVIGVFIDTFIVLNLTAFVILSTGVLTPDGSLQGIDLTQAGFSSVFGHFGNIFIAICMLFFAFSSIVGWYFFGQANVQYLFGKKSIKVYAVLVCFFVLIGATLNIDTIWTLSDLFNGFMVIPNLLGLLALSGVTAKLLREYESNESKMQKPGKRS